MLFTPYLAIIDPLMYFSVSRKNVGIETFTSKRVWSAGRERKYSTVQLEAYVQ